MKDILVVRRDNIGDLVCTTPLIAALRRRFPDAWIGALVNSYNAPVLDRNPDLDEVFAYTKLKHLAGEQSALRSLGDRLRQLLALRRRRLDCVVLATPGFSPRTLRLARWLGAREIAGFSDGSRASLALDRRVELSGLEGRHEVERVYALAPLLGIDFPPPPLRVVADSRAVDAARSAMAGLARPCIAVHISARRPAQRWSGEKFVSLIDRLTVEAGLGVVLLWSPGRGDHAQHPGDDDKAAAIAASVKDGKRVLAWRTTALEELVAALFVCDALVCSDGGAMHVAAAAGKPIVAFFGDSPVDRWHPWGVPYRILCPDSRNVADVAVGEAHAALMSLLGEAAVFRHPAV